MAFQITIALSFFVIFFVFSYKNDKETNDSAMLTLFSTFNEEKTTVMRVIFKSDDLNKRFGD